MKIITLTLNPAFDVHIEVNKLKMYRENYMSSFKKNAGGKGINISRALLKYGIKSKAICVLGEGKEEFLSLLDRDGLKVSPIYTEGKIRENITLHSEGKETRISSDGFCIGKEILEKLYEEISKEKEEALLVTFTGRVPRGVQNNEVIEFLKQIKRIGAKLVVDSNSFNMEELLKIKPFLIKPNEEEIASLLGYDTLDKEKLLKESKKLTKSGIENVIISLGAEGFVYSGKTGDYFVKAPRISPVSTIGAGDSTIAGFIAGILQGLEITQILKLASSFGSAACLTEGTNPPEKSDISGLEGYVVCEKIN